MNEVQFKESINQDQSQPKNRAKVHAQKPIPTFQ